ncbi:TPA: hypothetical protein UM046_004456 [Stenotrophomonas maltophilia]|nr:hypothetical protein [Stenotrophomonas maltophilia]HEL3786635.1 hypothetical protein [Stenotrophomonas maltophilia]
MREVLASAYSVNDKVRKAGYPNFFESDEFLTIKALRNYAIHQAEIYNKSRAVPMVSSVPIEAELNLLCLVPIAVMERVLKSTGSGDAIKKTCVFYRSYVDIYPSIFNFGVQLFIYTETHQLEVDSVEYREFSNSIEFERRNGYEHHVVGGVSLPSGLDVNEFIESSLHTMEERNEIQNSLYSEDGGMFTFQG